MRLNGLIYKYLRQPRHPIRVQLGPGQKNYLPGWVNVDGNILTAKVDVWANLLDPLPFRRGSVEMFYSFHVIEHLPDSHLPRHFRELYDALIPGGAIRVGGPDIGMACRKYVEGDEAWFSDFPDRRESVGGRFANFLFCRGEHLTALSRSYLTELATQAGFVDLQFCVPTKESNVAGAEVLSLEFETDFACPHTIVLEARKP
jgi:hypothetical protein